MDKKIIPVGSTLAEDIKNKIYVIRGEKVMLDFDLAALYQVKTKVLNQAVKRNRRRFPSDFIFKLTKNEEGNLKSQIVTSNLDKDGEIWRSQFVTAKSNLRRAPIYAFTEQGIAMLSSVLRSERAIQVNIQIMRTFTKLRQMLASHKELKEKIEELEKKYDGQFRVIFKTIQQLIIEEEKPKKKLGFNISINQTK